MLALEMMVREELALVKYLQEYAQELLCLVALEAAEEGVMGAAQERELEMAQGVAEGVGYEAGEPSDNILENGNDKQELLHDKPEVVYNMKDQLLHTEEIAGKI